MVVDIFRQFIEHFIKSIPSARPVLLLLDGHGSHVDLRTMERCVENGIILYALPSNTTHVLQPAEIPFKKLKSEYSSACERHWIKYDGAVITRHSFASLLGEAFEATYTPAVIRKSFKATGIWPLDPDVIQQERFNPSLTTYQPPSSEIDTQDVRRTRKKELERLREENDRLREEIQFMKTPGTASLHTILKYPSAPPRARCRCDEVQQPAKP